MNVSRGKRPTKGTSVAALQMQLRSLEARLNPNVKARPAASQPRPVTGAGDFWCTRRIQMTKVTGDAAKATAFTFGDIAKQLTNVAAGNVNVRITKVCIWGQIAQKLTATLDIQNFTDSVGSNSSNNGITTSDYGSGAKLPGIEWTIPKLVSDPKWINHGNVTEFISVPASAASGGTLVVECTVDFQPT